ncbi:MAG: hypothetical protein Unbinned5858contig1001_37 [Prokaryotic dsDNA virus sp.]|mgnify:CR=1 FL=1|nr:MAG: hypothetical protein Unbinned5858contig1001_37 [Prokaryotic dsDNA virus sp.]|tara:strand:+ start:216 stop:530 length:315 start_codon:yes stop_codon:yes gene_type:complete
MKYKELFIKRYNIKCNVNKDFIKDENTSKKMFLLFPANTVNEWKKDLKREVLIKQTSPYGITYKLKCGWIVELNYQYRRWEIETISSARFVARFNPEDVKEIIE